MAAPTAEELKAAFDRAETPEAKAKIAQLIQMHAMMNAGSQQTEDRGLGEAVRHGLQQGATFGFADEASAGVRALLDPLMDKMTGVPEDMQGGDQTLGERYEMYRDDERSQIAAGREHHGGAMMASEFLPGLLAGGAGLVGKGAGSGIRAGLDAAAQQGLKKTLPRMAGVGAGYGATAGLGYGESEGAGGMALDALTGAGLGAGLGVALPVVGAGIKRGASNLGRRLGMSGAGVQDAAREAARRQLIQDLKRDGLTPDEAAQVIAANDDYLLADLGENLGETLDNIMHMPGEGRTRLKQILTARQERAFDRAQPVLREGVEGSPLTSPGLKLPEEYGAIEAALRNNAQQLAKPLWAKAYLPNTEFAPTQWMKRLVARDGRGRIKDKRVRNADNTAREMLRNRVLTGEITAQEASFHSRYFDELQRALRDQSKATGAKAQQQLATSRSGVHRTLVDNMKKVMPDEWNAARKLHAGRRANEEALKAGEGIFSGNIGKHQTAVSGFGSKGERDNYLVGGLRAIEDKLMRGAETGDILRQLRSTRRGKEMIRLLFGDEKGFRRFMDFADVEEVMQRTYARMQQGSQTFGRAAKGADVGGAYGTLAGIMMGSSLGIPGAPLLARFAGRKVQQQFARADEMKRNEMAKLMTTRNPQQLTQGLQRAPLPTPPGMSIAALGGATQLPGMVDNPLQGLLED